MLGHQTDVHLRQHGIEVLHDAPGVGANLQDHLDICTLYRATKRVTYDRASELRIAFDYYLRGRRGAGTSNIAEAGGFVRSALAPDALADIQFHFVPAMLDDHGRNRLPGDGFPCTPASCARAAAGASPWPARTRPIRRGSNRGTCPTRRASTCE